MARAQAMELDFRCQRFDVVQAHYVLDVEKPHELEFLVQENFLHQLPERPKGNAPLMDLELKEQLGFLGERSCFLYKFIDLYKEQLKEKELSDIYYRLDDLLIPVLSKMERQGICLNARFFHQFERELEEKLGAIEKKILSHNDGEPINLNSPKQVSEFLFDKLKMPILRKTKTGHSTDSAVLESLVAKNLHPVPGLLLQYREIGKLLSTYVKVLPTLVHPTSGRIHTHFNQNVTATGRLSSHQPNLQNIPIRGDLGKRVRKGLIAQPGKLFLAADYSQVELRLLAHFCADETMLESFHRGIDIHRQTAAEIMAIPLEEVSAEDRSRAKAVNFGLIYGQSSFGLAGQLKISPARGQRVYGNLFQPLQAH